LIKNFGCNYNTDINEIVSLKYAEIKHFEFFVALFLGALLLLLATFLYSCYPFIPQLLRRFIIFQIQDVPSCVSKVL
jgi:hypothetical protein